MSGKILYLLNKKIRNVMLTPRKIQLVFDIPLLTSYVKQLLEMHNYQVSSTNNLTDTISDVELVIVSFTLLKRNDNVIPYLQQLRQYSNAPVIVISCTVTDPDYALLQQANLAILLPTTTSTTELVNTIDQALKLKLAG